MKPEAGEECVSGVRVRMEGEWWKAAGVTGHGGLCMMGVCKSKLCRESGVREVSGQGMDPNNTQKIVKGCWVRDCEMLLCRNGVGLCEKQEVDSVA